jgi:hypothetical protein
LAKRYCLTRFDRPDCGLIWNPSVSFFCIRFFKVLNPKDQHPLHDFVQFLTAKQSKIKNRRYIQAIFRFIEFKTSLKN